MDVTLAINGLDLHGKLSTYSVEKEVEYRKVITTLDDVEHPYPGTQKTVITFSLLPQTGEESEALYSALEGLVFDAKYTDPHTGLDESKTVRVVSNIESVFALKSVDGKRRYKGGSIQLRGL